jgi:NTP pyrophosphatase (non-canonical NTP hydrolase)
MEFDQPNFLEPIQSSLQRVQTLFDQYQQARFTPRSPEFFCLELCGEAGELANLQKKLWKGKDIEHAHLADEAADVLIALMNYANAADIDLAAAVADKLRRIEEKRKMLEERGEKY